MPAHPDDGSGPLDVDAAFAEIVAHWDEPANPPAEAREEPTGAGGPAVPPPVLRKDPAPDQARTVRPARELPPAPREDTLPGRHSRPEGPNPPAAHATHRRDADGLGARRPDDDDDPWQLDEGFVPAEPKPLPRDFLGWAAWAAVIGAPILLLVLALSWREVPPLLTALIAAVFVAGFATLVVRLPSSRDDDDDGAVV